MEKNMADVFSKSGAVYDIEPQGSYKGSKLYSGRIKETGKMLVFCSNNSISVSDWDDEYDDDVKDMIKELKWLIDEVEKDLEEIRSCNGRGVIVNN